MKNSTRDKSSFIGIRLTIFFVFIFLIDLNSSAQDQKVIAKLTVDNSTVVRFLFRPLNSNHVYPALIFRVADLGDSKWNTAPIDRFGRSAYIHLAEMRSLVRKLDKERALWQVSSAKETIEPFEDEPLNENLLATIYASDGTATANISTKEICKNLSLLNKLIETRRAHWEFEYFRRGCGCRVLGYKSDAYPNNR